MKPLILTLCYLSLIGYSRYHDIGPYTIFTDYPSDLFIYCCSFFSIFKRENALVEIVL